MFGGFYSGQKYNYIAFGQSKREEKDEKEVIRIVRYDKDFNRIDNVSIKGGESFTIEPFDAGCGRMAEYDDTLVFHTSRLRYTTKNGLNHQSQLTIIVNTSRMRVKNYLGEFQSNHVSHSFDQYVLFDGNCHVLIDHGDANRLTVIWQEFERNSQNRFMRGDLKYVLIDESGNPISEIQTVKNFVLSRCQPIVIDNKIVWYTNENGMRFFYSIQLEKTNKNSMVLKLIAGLKIYEKKIWNYCSYLF